MEMIVVPNIRNNADYGLTLQKIVCDTFELPINSQAYAQFNSSYNKEYEKDLIHIVPEIFTASASKSGFFI